MSSVSRRLPRLLLLLTLAALAPALTRAVPAAAAVIPVTAVTVAPASVTGGAAATGKVTLASAPAAGSGGQVVNLSSSNPAAAGVPATVTVVEGQTSATFNISTSPVASDAAVVISAESGGATKTAALTVKAPALLSVKLSPASVTGGVASSGTVTLTGAPAPGSGGVTVTLSSADTSVADVSAPSVTVAEGQTTAAFSVTTVPVAVKTIVTVTGVGGGVTKTAKLTVNPPVPKTVTFSPASLTGGTPSTGTVTLTGPAPAGGVTVQLASDKPQANLPAASVLVPAGSLTQTFAVNTLPVAADAVANIAATANGVSKAGKLTIKAPVLSSLKLSPTSTPGGLNVTGTVTLTGPVAAGSSVTVALASANTALATVPAPVAVTAGQSSAAFTIATTPVTAAVSVSITAKTTTPAVTKSATLKLNPPALSSLSMSPASVVGGSPSTGTVTLTGPAPSAGTAVTLTSSKTTVATVPANVTVASGSTTATFTANTIAQSVNSTSSTITAKVGSVSKTATLTVTKTNTPPVANAGPDQSKKISQLVQLDGSASTDPEGGPLTYIWSFISKPGGSSAALSDAAAVNPTFTIDVYGQYVLQLVVSDGTSNSAPDTVTVNTANTAPVAGAGPDQTRKVGDTVQLDGSGSTDVDGHPLTYAWSLTEKPAGSAAALSDPAAVNPTFTKDAKGAYKARLVVNDGTEDSAPDEVVINHENTAPAASAGPDQTRKVGESVQLTGSGSTDVDGDTLTYNWSIISKPDGSNAALSDPAAVNPTFTKDLKGTYVLQLIVNDGTADSAADTVTINHTNSAPVANAGTNQTVGLNSAVQLTGAGSTDADGDALTYQWSFASKPAGSGAALSDATAANPTFVADLGGSYVLQLIVNDGTAESAPSTVTVSTDYVPPIAAAGPDQNAVLVGSTVQLDGSGSSSPAGNPLTYQWALIAKPSGSAAALSDAAAANPTFVVDKVGTYVAQLIVNDGVQDSAPDTVEINTPRISVTVNIPSLLTTAKTTGKAHLDVPAPAGGQIVFLATNNASLAAIKGAAGCPNDADCVVIPEGQKDSPDFELFSHTQTGSATLTAFADGFIDGTAGFAVSARQMKLEVLAPNPKFIGVGRTTKLTLTLTDPAPACPSGTPFACADGVTVEVASSANGVADITPPSVALAAGTTTQEFTVTGVNSGAATFSAQAAGYGNANSPAVAVTSSDLIYIPTTQTVAPGQTLTYPVSLSKPAPAGGITVRLESSDPGVASVSPTNVTIPAGATTPATQPQVTGVSFGTVGVTATDVTGPEPLYAGDTRPVVVGLSLNFSAPGVTVPQDNTRTMDLSLSAPAPAGGVTVNLSTDQPARATTTESSVTFAQGESTKTVTVLGVSVGSTTLRASGANISEATASITVSPAPAINLGGATVGKDLQTTTNGSLAAAAPIGNLQVTITSSDDTKVLLSKTPNGAGSKSITVEVGAGSSSIPTFYVQGLRDGGTVALTAKAPDYANGTSTVTLTPSGFQLTSNNFTTTSSSPNTVLTARVVRLNAGTLTAANDSPVQTLRAGIDPVSVPVTSSDTTVGEITTSPVVFQGGESSLTSSFDPIGGGTATISVTQPAGFSTPVSGTQITATVTAPGISLSGATVGKDLQTTTGGSLAAPAPAGNLQVTITSLDPGKVLLAKDATTLGANSITLQVSAGSQSIPTFYVQGVSGTGTTQIKVTAPGFTQQAATITLRPSGFAINPYQISCVGCYGNPPTVSTTTFSANTDLYVIAAALDPTTFNYSQSQPLRPGVTASVGVTSGDTAVGTITLSPLSFGANEYYKATQFDPDGAGTSVVSLVQPPGWTPPNNVKTVNFNVALPDISLSNVTVGKNLQTTASASLGAPAPAGNVTMTITVADDTKALLATSPTAAGSKTLTFTIFAGSYGPPTFYVQALDNSGTVQYTASAPGYNSKTATINLRHSGFVVSGYPYPGSSYVFNYQINTTTFSGNSPFYVYSAYLTPSLGYEAAQPLRPGLGPVSVGVVSGTPNVGTTTVNPVAFGANEYYRGTEFDPAEAGTTVISLTPPSGWSTPTNFQQVTAAVTAPDISLSGVAVGKDLQQSVSASLGAPAPAGGVTMTITVADAGKVRLSPSAISPGDASGVLTFNIPAGSYSTPAFYVQALEGGGTVQYTASAPGYNSKTATINLRPSGFVIGPSLTSNSGSGFNSLPYVYGTTLSTTTFSANSTLHIGPAMLDSNHNQLGLQPLRPGVASLAVDVISSDPAVGSVLMFGGFAEDSAGNNDGTLENGVAFAAGQVGKAFSFDGTNDEVTIPTVNAGGAYTLNFWFNPATRTTPNNYEHIISHDWRSAGNFGALYVKTDAKKIEYWANNSLIVASATNSVPFDAWTHVALTYDGSVNRLYLNGVLAGTGGARTETFNNPVKFGYTVNNADSSRYKGLLDEVELFNRPLTEAEIQSTYAGGQIPDAVSRWRAEDKSAVTIKVNQSRDTFEFDPAAAGTTTLTVVQPAGWTPPSNQQQVTATVTAPDLHLSNVTVGKDLQENASISLGAPAPAGGVTVTVTVADSSKVRLAASPTEVGSGTLTFNVVAGQSGIPTFYVQALSADGAVTYTASAPGYNSKTATINLRPSGFVIGTNLYCCYSAQVTTLSTTTFSPNSTLYVGPAMLDPTYHTQVDIQPLRAGVTASVSFTSSDTAVGTISPSPLSFGANESYKQVQFDPATAGTTILSITQPANWTPPSDQQQVTATVTAPNINLSSTIVGKNLQTTTSASLGAPAPSGGVTMTVTVADPTKALLSTSATAAGSASLTFNITAGQSSTPTFYVQALQGSNPDGSGSEVVQYTASAPGYANQSSNITLYPSGFVITSFGTGFTTQVGAADTTLTVVPAALDPVSLNYYTQQQLRPGMTNTQVTVTSSNTAVGTITVSPVTFNGADSPNSRTTSFHPAGAGSSVIKVTGPTGFRPASNNNNITATVNP
jgi:hypothetical protein